MPNESKDYSHNYLRYTIIIIWICIIGVVVGCTSLTTSHPLPNKSNTPIPIYTPIISPIDSNPPTRSQFVTIEELVTNPEIYQDLFVEVHGFNEGALMRPGCAGWVAPPAEWGLTAAKTEYKDNVPVSYPPRIDIKNRFNGMISSPSGADGWAIRDVMLKKVAVWGWLRLYEGPVGCASTNLDGTPIPLEIQRVWYIDAVKLQFLESIEVDRKR